MRTLAVALLTCLLPACAMPAKTTTTTVVTSAKPACDRSSSVTGSHMMGNCDRSSVAVVGADGVGTTMRQNPGAAISSH
jgi:hypothetical protein